MRKEQIAIIAIGIWLTLISVFMLLAQSFDLEILFVLSLIGFFVILELISPKYVQPDFKRYIWYLIAVGIVIFCAIVAQKVLEIFGLKIVFY